MARIGLVLGAGGATGGAFHAGVLAALEEATGWDPRTAELILGTSAGSITAAMLRAGLSGADIAARTAGEPLSPEGAARLRSAGVAPGQAPAGSDVGSRGAPDGRQAGGPHRFTAQPVAGDGAERRFTAGRRWSPRPP